MIFDCDGVLVDSERLSHTVLQAMLSELGVHLGFEETVDRFIGTSMPTCLARIAELLGASPPDRFVEQFAARTKAAFQTGLTSISGVEAVLGSLTENYCVASNGNRAKVNFTLNHTGLLERFEGRIFCAEDVKNPKPAPDLFLHAAQSMGSVAENTIVIEDTPTGIAAARAAGMRTIGFAAMTSAARLEAAGAHVIAADMSQVHELLQRSSAAV